MSRDFFCILKMKDGRDLRIDASRDEIVSARDASRGGPIDLPSDGETIAIDPAEITAITESPTTSA